MGMIELLMQYLRKGFDVVARNLKCLLCNTKVVICQLMMKMPIAIPVIAELTAFTLPRYSGARKSASAPNVFIKLPLMALPMMNQNTNSTWYFLKWRNTNCTGNECQRPFRNSFIFLFVCAPLIYEPGTWSTPAKAAGSWPQTGVLHLTRAAHVCRLNTVR